MNWCSKLYTFFVCHCYIIGDLFYSCPSYYQFITKEAYIPVAQMVQTPAVPKLWVYFFIHIYQINKCKLFSVPNSRRRTHKHAHKCWCSEKQHHATFACWNIYSFGQASDGEGGKEGGGNCGIGGEGGQKRGGRDAARIPPLPRNSDRKNGVCVRTRVCVRREELHAHASVCDTKSEIGTAYSSWWRYNRDRWWCVYMSVCVRSRSK